MDKIALISTPISEAWPTWLMLVLLLSLILLEVLQPNLIRSAFRATFTKMERMYGDQSMDIMSTLTLNIFRIGTLAMALYAFTYRNAPFSFLTYVYIILIICGVLAIKALFGWLVSYVFEFQRTTALYVPQYNNLWTLFCMVLYPITLLYINASELEFLVWLPITAIIVFAALLLFKQLQYFYAGPASLLYLLIYTVTLELLPIGATIVTVTYIA